MYSRSEMFQWLSNHMIATLHLTTETRHASKHSAVEKALHYMNEHYSRDLSLQEVAEQVSLNATYFSLLFKEEVGISYIKHLTKIRLEHAKALLSEGARVNEVSEKVGYHNYRHFTEMFKKNLWDYAWPIPGIDGANAIPRGAAYKREGGGVKRFCHFFQE